MVRTVLTACKSIIFVLNRKVTMLECNAILTLFAHYICLHGYIHFIYLFNPNTKYRDMYHILQISQKILRYEFLAHIAQPYYEETCIW